MHRRTALFFGCAAIFALTRFCAAQKPMRSPWNIKKIELTSIPYASTRGISSARELTLHTVDIEQAHANGVELFMPPKTAKSPKKRGRELEPEAGDSEAVLAWKQRMSSEAGEQIYKQRAATSETVNADLRSYRGLGQITVRGLAKAQCVALWCALAYNILHFAATLLG
jgi:hypothetical protein